jgi:hypothetical protein
MFPVELPSQLTQGMMGVGKGKVSNMFEPYKCDQQGW